MKTLHSTHTISITPTLYTLVSEVIMHRSWMILLLVSFAGYLVASPLHAQTQPDMLKVFPDPVTSAFGGNINLNGDVVMKGGDGQLNFSSVSDNAKACAEKTCTQAKGSAAALTLPDFMTASSNTQLVVSKDQSLTASIDYNQVTVNNNVTFKLSIKDASDRIAIQNLSLSPGSTLILSDGIYFVENMRITKATIKLQSRTTKAVILVKNLDANNAQINNAAVEQNFGFVVYSSANFSGDVDLDGFIYSLNNVNINGNYNQEGSISSKNFSLNGTVFIDYDPVAAAKIGVYDFIPPSSKIADSPTLIGHWPMDICPTDGSTTILDVVANHNAEAKINTVMENDGKYCQSGRLNGTGAHIYIPDAPHLRGEKGTVSFWFNVDNLDHSNDYMQGGQYLFSRDSLEKDLGGHLTSWLESDGSVHVRYQTNSQDFFIHTDDRIISAEQWYFYTITWDNQTTKLYINGEMVGENTQSSGSQKLNPEPMVFGGNARRSSQAETTPDDLKDFFRGNIDDIRWYDDALSTTEIVALKTAEQYECNACGSDPNKKLVAEYRFADTTWGNPGDIQDSSGNAFHATLSGETRLLTPVNNMSCGTLDIPPNTNQTTPDFVDTPIDLETDVGPQGTISFWFKSNSGWQDERDRTLFDAVMISEATTKHVNNKYFYLMLKQNGRLQFGFEDSKDRDIRYDSEPFDFPEYTWVHLALTYNYESKIVDIYMNGEKQTFTISPSDYNRNWNSWDGIMPDYGNLALADNRTDYITASSSANGRYDDIRVYNFEQNSAEIKEDMAKADACAVLYGYQIDHPDQALTCDSAPVTVKACKNEDCSELYEHTVQVSLSPSPNGDPAGQVYEFKREFTFDLVSRTPGTKNLVFTPMYHAKAEELVNTCSNDCEIEFVDAGLQMYINQPTNYGLDATLQRQSLLTGLVAGAPMSSIKMRAVRDNNGVCEEVVTGEQDVALTYSCYQHNALGIPIQGCAVPFANFPLDTTNGYITKTAKMTFDQNAVTDYSQFTLPDATNFTLKAQMNIDGATLKSNNLNLEFTPAGIQLSHDIVDDHVAGTPFTFNIKGYGYNNISLPSYNPDKLEVYASRVAPSTGTAYGSFTFGQGYVISSDPLFNLVVPSTPFYGSQIRFNNGAYSYDQAMFTDIGALEVYVIDKHTFREVQSNTLRIGPFIPAYFDVAEVYTPAFDHATSNAFTYLGQPFFFDISALPQIEVTAYNALGQVVPNYDGSEWKLAPTASQALNEIGYTDVSGSGLGLSLSTTPTAPTLTGLSDTDGKGKITLNNIALTYGKTAVPINAFQTGVDMTIAADFLTDANGTCYQQSYPNGCSTFTFSNLTGTEQRYGRLYIDNAYGPENQALYLPISAQFFTNGEWRLNTDDNSTNINISQALGQLTLTNLADSETDITSLYTGIQSSGFLTGGLSDVNDLRFPAANARGGMLVTISTLVGSPAWAQHLNYDWNGDGVINGLDMPAATVNFGVFRGNDRKINFREVLE